MLYDHTSRNIYNPVLATFLDEFVKKYSGEYPAFYPVGKIDPSFKKLVSDL